MSGALAIPSTPYYLAFAAGGRPNACYSPLSPAPEPTPPTPVDLPVLPPPLLSPPSSPALPSATPADVPALDQLSVKATLPVKDLALSSADSLYKKEVDDALALAAPAAVAAPVAPSYPSHRTRGGYGQDAWFVDSVPGSALHSFGVADGVGGWRSQGVDSGIISRAVMDKCMEQAARSRDTIDPSAAYQSSIDGSRRWSAGKSPPALGTSASAPPTLPFSLPSHILGKAYASVKEEKVVLAGSTTACVLTVTPYRCLPRRSAVLTGAGPERRESGDSDPRSPPPSPRESARAGSVDFDNRHQLSAEDEQKDARPSSSAVPVPVPTNGAVFMDSDSDSDVDASFTSHLSPTSSTVSTDSSLASSLSYKTASAFWSAVGQVMSPSTNASSLSSTSSASPSQPSTPLISPPPSRPPSPSSPPLFLSCASLGDSGFLLLRHHRVIHRSDIQRNGRIVKQLAIIPPHLAGPQHRYCDDSPSDASLSSHRLEEGDLIIVGSDGLLDNLCSSWSGSSSLSGGFFMPWGRFLLGGGGGGEEEGEKEVLDKQNKRVENLVKEVWIDWEAREAEVAVAAAGGGAWRGGKDGFVRLLCDRLVSEASEFMTTVEGKPDDLTVLVAQVGKIR